MTRLLLLFTVLCISLTGFAQVSDITTSLTLELDQQTNLPDIDQFIGYDSYDQLYWVDKNTLYKRGTLGNFEFLELMLGPIDHVDLQNPLTVLIFYAETNTLVFLDNRLNEKKRIDFNLITEFPQVQWTYNAGSNRLWIMDQNSQRLWVYDTQKMKVVVQSPPLPNLISLKCRFNDCIAQTTDELIYLSLYGTITKREAFTGGILKDYNERHTIVSDQSALFDFKSNQELNFPEIRPENQINDLQLTQDFLYIYDSNVIWRYALNPIKNK